MIEIARVNARHSRQNVENNEPRGAIELFHLRADNPQRIGIEEQMQHPDMYEDWSNEPPPFASRNRRIGLDPECHECRFIGAAAGERHQEKDDDVCTEEYVREKRAAAPDRV